MPDGGRDGGGKWGACSDIRATTPARQFDDMGTKKSPRRQQRSSRVPWAQRHQRGNNGDMTAAENGPRVWTSQRQHRHGNSTTWTRRHYRDNNSTAVERHCHRDINENNNGDITIGDGSDLRFSSWGLSMDTTLRIEVKTGENTTSRNDAGTP